MTDGFITCPVIPHQVQDDRKGVRNSKEKFCDASWGVS